MPPGGAQVPSLQFTGKPAGQIGHAAAFGAHQLPMQHTVPDGQQLFPQELAHSQMPAGGPEPQQ
jgi:hypothetical protein